MPLTYEISLVLVLVVSAISFVIGLMLGKASPSWLKAAIALATLLIVVRFALLRNPQIEYRLFEGDWYAAIRPWWGFPPALFLTGAAVHQVDRFSVRVLAKAAAIVVFFVATRAVVAALTMDHTTRTTNFPDPDSGLVTQKTLYSCGAASAAMLLHFEGIRVSEGEMGTLCRTNAATATDEFSVRAGLRKKLTESRSEKQIRLKYTDFETISQHQGPFMAVIRFERLLDHWVVVESISEEDGTFRVLNPEGFVIGYTPEDFKAVWKNQILFIE